MNKQLLFFKTHSSGFPLFHEPSSHPDQPHIVSLGALLVDAKTFKINEMFYGVSQRDNWISEPQATQFHGISSEEANKTGMPEKEILDRFMGFVLEISNVTRVTYALPFEDRMIRIALKRFYGEKIGALTENYKAASKFCCQAQSRGIMNLVSEKTGRKKNPRLTEAYGYFTGANYEKSPHALDDAEACIEVYKGILNYHSNKSQEILSNLNL